METKLLWWTLKIQNLARPRLLDTTRRLLMALLNDQSYSITAWRHRMFRPRALDAAAEEVLA